MSRCSAPSVPPRTGDSFRGVVLDAAAAEKPLDRPKDWPEMAFTPSPVQNAGSLAEVAIGFAATLGVARLGRGKPGE